MIQKILIGFYLIIPFVSFCQNEKVEFSIINIQDTIIVTMLNQSDTDIYIEDIGCYGTVIPFLFLDDGMKVESKSMIKPNMDRCEKMLLKANSIIKKRYDTKIETLFDIDRSKAYSLYFVYYGIIELADHKTDKLIEKVPKLFKLRSNIIIF